jgi:hypothetical protein
LRRIKSVLTKVALAAIITASIVKAQQQQPTAAEPFDQIADSPDPSNKSLTPKSGGDSLYGISSTRGIRYLLRNGLDYLEYGEYKRALIFLRETESRKNELNNVEILVLKKSIEKAQRGLRDGANAADPYALSDRARDQDGFIPAKPKARSNDGGKLASRSQRREPMLKRDTSQLSMRDSDDQGEPIQLVQANADSEARKSQNSGVTQKVTADAESSGSPSSSNQPREFPAIAQPVGESRELADVATRSDDKTEVAQALHSGPTDNEAKVQLGGDSVAELESTNSKSATEKSPVLSHSATQYVDPIQKSDQYAYATQANPDDLPPVPVKLNEVLASNDSVAHTGQESSVPNSMAQPLNETLPVLPHDPNYAIKPAADAQLSRASSNAVGDTTMTSQTSAEDPVTASSPATLDRSRQLNHEDAAPLAPFSARDANASLIASPSDGSSASSPASIEPMQSPVARPEGSSARTDLRTPEVNQPLLNANQNSPKRESATVSSTSDAQFHLPPPIEALDVSSGIDSIVPNRTVPPSTLRPELKREVELIARKQDDELRRRQQGQPAAATHDTIISDLRAQTQLDISRAPSPAEARPIKAIPVPEDWVPLAQRSWSAQHKYWAAAATCHLPLYFQDPVLERYGHSVEQFVGPIGRYLTYPLDDPSQSSQRNQILQPFFSAGLFAFQIAALPYNVIVDPPWEAQYDLGYFRPGDVIPTDTYWLPLHGYGPPLNGSNY